jgi:hypothetical protein
MKVIVSEVLYDEQKTSKNNKQYTVTTFKDAEGTLYKEVYGKFTVGQEVEGEWKDTQYGRKFEVARSGGFTGGRTSSPEERASIERQSALKAAVEATRDSYTIPSEGVEKLSPEQYVAAVLMTAKKFEAFLHNNGAQTMVRDEPPVEARQAQGEINVDSIPF